MVITSPYGDIELDKRAILPGARIAAIRTPTLIFHALDDTLQLYENAAFAAATIPGARLINYGRGGHVLLAVEQSAIMRETRDHIFSHVGPTASGQMP